MRDKQLCGAENSEGHAMPWHGLGQRSLPSSWRSKHRSADFGGPCTHRGGAAWDKKGEDGGLADAQEN